MLGHFFSTCSEVVSTHFPPHIASVFRKLLPFTVGVKSELLRFGTFMQPTYHTGKVGQTIAKCCCKVPWFCIYSQKAQVQSLTLYCKPSPIPQNTREIYLTTIITSSLTSVPLPNPYLLALSHASQLVVKSPISSSNIRPPLLKSVFCCSQQLI